MLPHLLELVRNLVGILCNLQRQVKECALMKKGQDEAIWACCSVLKTMLCLSLCKYKRQSNC